MPADTISQEKNPSGSPGCSMQRPIPPPVGLDLQARLIIGIENARHHLTTIHI